DRAAGTDIGDAGGQIPRLISVADLSEDTRHASGVFGIKQLLQYRADAPGRRGCRDGRAGRHRRHQHGGGEQTGGRPARQDSSPSRCAWRGLIILATTLPWNRPNGQLTSRPHADVTRTGPPAPALGKRAALPLPSQPSTRDLDAAAEARLSTTTGAAASEFT
ncbi:MAG: hypothetical protein ACJ786_24375, partial [Catenulispora sp.]